MRKSLLISLMLFPLLLSSCFTGVEGTKKVTDKDVAKVLQQPSGDSHTEQQLLQLTRADSVATWPVGKRFFVCDDQARLMFLPSAEYSTDTLRLGGKSVSYAGYTTGSLLDNNSLVTLQFTDGVHTYSYRTGKELADLHPAYSIPFFIDEDVVNRARQQLDGKTFYIKTRIWYEPENEVMKDGRQFIPVKIVKVEPGNKVYALKLTFEAQDNGEQAMVWIADDTKALRQRSFDALFSVADVRKNYPHITADVWEHIVHGTVQVDMTKEECQLSLGAPKSINRLPNQNGLREYWYYDGGVYLYFEDGLLKTFRK
jgi:hypothetical protein